MADRVRKAKGDVRRVIRAQTGAAHHDAMGAAFAAREIEHVMNDHPLESVMRPHPVGGMDRLVIKAVEVRRVRAINRDLAAIDEAGDRIGKPEILVLGIAAERRRKQNKRNAAAVAASEHLEIAIQMGRPPTDVAFVHRDRILYARVISQTVKRFLDKSESPRDAFRLHAANNAYRKHSKTCRLSVPDSQEPP